MSHLIEMSNITTRANNQFPRPDFHRLDKQPYRLQPLARGAKLWPRQSRKAESRQGLSPLITNGLFDTALLVERGITVRSPSTPFPYARDRSRVSKSPSRQPVPEPVAAAPKL